jgi:hypothetical protein
MQVYGVHDVALFNGLNNFSIESTKILYPIYHIPKIRAVYSEKESLLHWCAYSITLTFSVSLHHACITQMMSLQNICMAVQYRFYGVAKAAQVCDKNRYQQDIEKHDLNWNSHANM